MPYLKEIEKKLFHYMEETNSVQYTKCIYFGYLAIFSGLAECIVSGNNTHCASATEPIKFEMNYS